MGGEEKREGKMFAWPLQRNAVQGSGNARLAMGCSATVDQAAASLGASPIPKGFPGSVETRLFSLSISPIRHLLPFPPASLLRSIPCSLELACIASQRRCIASLPHRS